jgi:hypothetical protein
MFGPKALNKEHLKKTSNVIFITKKTVHCKTSVFLSTKSLNVNKTIWNLSTGFVY